jgi:uncharacterized protein (TIGR03435 family)
VTFQAVHLIFLAFTIYAIHAQSTPDPRFDVASVKPNRSSACRGRWDFSTSNGMVTADNAPLLRIISRAYNLTDDRVSGPPWLETQCYDIQAKAPANTPDPDLMRMLQALLKDRFHLAAQLESDQRPVLVLLIDKGGSKLRPYGGQASTTSSRVEGGILFMARHLPDLCERLGKVTGRPVIDKTGLDGDYLIELTYHPYLATGGDPSEPASDIFSAVREQLGLRLEAHRETVDILKISRIDRIPAQN